ncbi:MAG: phosphotransferase, partial [Phycisphaerales bacterium]
MIEHLAVLDVEDDSPESLVLPSGPLTLRKAWPRSKEHLLLEYVDRQGGVVPGQWMRDAGQLLRIADETADKCPNAPPVVVQTDHTRILLQPGGADRRLIGLSALLSRPDSTLLSHRPERRAVVRLHGATDQRYAKVVRPSRVRRVVESAQCLGGWPDRPFGVPEVIEVDESRGVVMFAVLPGVRLHELLDAGERFIDSARAAGKALRSFHSAAPKQAQEHDAQAEIRVLQKWLDDLKAFRPAPYRRLGNAPARVFEALATDSSRPTMIHRDFYDKQIIIDPAGLVGILDLD